MTIYYSAHARYSSLPPEPAGFQILHVCVANQCRSPIGEHITRHVLTRALPDGHRAWGVGSAGTQASDDQPMHRYSVRALRGLGVDPDGFRSRRLTPEIALGADLILTATGAERDFVISKVPATLPTAFTLLEFARLVTAVPTNSVTPEAVAAGSPGSLPAQQVQPSRQERPRRDGEPSELECAATAMVAAARKLRGRVPYVEPACDDIADPSRNAAAFDHCAEEIARAVDAILGALTGAKVPVPAR